MRLRVSRYDQISALPDALPKQVRDGRLSPGKERVMSTETLSRYERLPTDGTASMVEIPQYGMHVMLAVWAAAALPMALLAWLVAPALADRLTGDGNMPMVKALLLCLTGGPDLAVRAARRTALARAAHVSLVDDSPSPLASLSKQPAERPLRRKAVADSDPAHRGSHGRGRRPMGDRSG
jgi:hypothetical protein